ncbi:MAG: 3-deoxy-7-phosphoheptulonate synthase [Candidatus Handelsmanbacteria bacterium]|nr:3-deoxy-7-phosphoheptulonate synthase [Candidatus Handelsmanbacteria bacterium]
MQQTQDLNIAEMIQLTPPRAFKAEMPASEKANQTVVAGREAVKRILRQEDRRLLAIVGPCSIHDPQAAREYAGRLNALRMELEDRICVVMRVYFEKPRTTVGWKGLISDPHLDGSDDMATGLRLARQLLLDINEMGLPAGTEMLDPITPQYNADLIAWASIGARTTESQTHREMASGLSMPVGFKNSTAGDLQVALNAMESARHPHSFLGIDQEGRTCLVRTKGNPLGHLVLRGGSAKPNYDAESLAAAASQLRQAGLASVLLVDCSHANSSKKHERQEEVWQDLLQQRLGGNQDLIGMMVESNLAEGNQKIPKDKKDLKYGVSITDACVGWETTERMLRQAYAQL